VLFLCPRSIHCLWVGGVVEQNDRYVLEFYLDDATSVTLMVDVSLPVLVINK
jgi:hypothetical protein